MRLIQKNFFEVLFEVDAESVRDEETFISNGRRWEEHLCLQWQNKVLKSKVVIDCGASFGWYTCLAAKWILEGGIIYSYEPNPVMFQRLQRNIGLNRFNNVILRNVAVSDREGSAFVCPCEKQQQVLYEPKKTMWKNEVLPDMIPCATVTLDKDITNVEHRRAVGLVKLDVEGHELKVLKGMEEILQLNPQIHIFCDIHTKSMMTFGNSPEEMWKWLKDRDFTMTNRGKGEDHFQTQIMRG